MKCDRQTPEKFWINLGKRAAYAGYSLEWTIQPIAPQYTKAREWATAGYAWQAAKMARAAAKARAK